MLEKVAGQFRRLVEFNIPEQYRGQGRDAMRWRVLVSVIFALVFTELLLFLVFDKIMPFSHQGRTLWYDLIIFILVASLLALLVLRLQQRLDLSVNLMAICMWVALGYAVWFTGGVESIALSTFLLLPVFVAVTLGARWGLLWTLIVMGTWLAFFVAGSRGFEFPQITVPENVALAKVICLTLTLLVVSLAIMQYDNTTTRLWKELQRERTDLEILSRHDQLTGLPNRRHFAEELQKAISRASRHNSEFALIFFDLNDFKAVNDNYGHDIGDQLLQTIAERLVERFRITDFLSRWGGDEFALIVDNVSAPATLSKVIDDLSEATSRPVSLAGTTLSITPSVGVAIYPRDGKDSEQLLRRADQSMYQAKEEYHKACLA